MAKKNYYAVVNGRQPGIYATWSGLEGAEAQIKGYPGARYKGFATLDDAKAWYNKGTALNILGRHDEALTACDKTLEIKPDFAEAWFNKGVALRKIE